MQTRFGELVSAINEIKHEDVKRIIVGSQGILDEVSDNAEMLVNAINKAKRYTLPGHPGVTPLHFAVIAGDKQIIEILLAKNPQLINKALEDDRSLNLTPLTLAIHLGLEDIVTLLIKNGADIDKAIAQKENIGEDRFIEIIQKLNENQQEETAEKIQSKLTIATNTVSTDVENNQLPQFQASESNYNPAEDIDNYTVELWNTLMRKYSGNPYKITHDDTHEVFTAINEKIQANPNLLAHQNPKNELTDIELMKNIFDLIIENIPMTECNLLYLNFRQNVGIFDKDNGKELYKKLSEAKNAWPEKAVSTQEIKSVSSQKVKAVSTQEKNVDSPQLQSTKTVSNSRNATQTNRATKPKAVKSNVNELKNLKRSIIEFALNYQSSNGTVHSGIGEFKQLPDQTWQKLVEISTSRKSFFSDLFAKSNIFGHGRDTMVDQLYQLVTKIENKQLTDDEINYQLAKYTFLNHAIIKKPNINPNGDDQIRALQSFNENAQMLFVNTSRSDNSKAANDIITLDNLVYAQEKRDVIHQLVKEINRLEENDQQIFSWSGTDIKVKAYEQVISAIKESKPDESVGQVLHRVKGEKINIRLNETEYCEDESGNKIEMPNNPQPTVDNILTWRRNKISLFSSDSAAAWHKLLKDYPDGKPQLLTRNRNL